MINRIKNINLLNESTVAGLEVLILSNDKSIYNLVIQKRSGQEINFEKIAIDIQELKDVRTYIANRIPVSLVINGKGILTRVFDQNKHNNQQILRMMLPNGSLNEFYLQRNHITNQKEMVSLARRETVDQILGNLTEYKFQITDLYIGPANIGGILGIIDNLPDQLIVHGNCILSENLELSGYNQRSENEENPDYKIGGEIVSGNAIPALSSGFNWLILNSARTQSGITSVQTAAREYKYLRLAGLVGKVILGFVFGSLLINFLIFDHFNKKYNTLSSEVTGYQDILSNYKRLEKELQSKSELLKESGLLNPSRISFYADRLAADLPRGIKLTQLEIFPVIENRSKNREIIIMDNSILISGTSDKSSLLNEWIKLIQQYEWIETVSNFNYITSNKRNNGLGTFSLELKLI